MNRLTLETENFMLLLESNPQELEPNNFSFQHVDLTSSNFNSKGPSINNVGIFDQVLTPPTSQFPMLFMDGTQTVWRTSCHFRKEGSLLNR